MRYGGIRACGLSPTRVPLLRVAADGTAKREEHLFPKSSITSLRGGIPLLYRWRRTRRVRSARKLRMAFATQANHSQRGRPDDEEAQTSCALSRGRQRSSSLYTERTRRYTPVILPLVTLSPPHQTIRSKASVLHVLSALP